MFKKSLLKPDELENLKLWNKTFFPQPLKKTWAKKKNHAKIPGLIVNDQLCSFIILYYFVSCWYLVLCPRLEKHVESGHRGLKRLFITLFGWLFTVYFSHSSILYFCAVMVKHNTSTYAYFKSDSSGKRDENKCNDKFDRNVVTAFSMLVQGGFYLNVFNTQ